MVDHPAFRAALARRSEKVGKETSNDAGQIEPYAQAVARNPCFGDDRSGAIIDDHGTGDRYSKRALHEYARHGHAIS